MWAFFSILKGRAVERVLTKTMAEIYLRQGHLQEAFEIFKALSEKNPSDRETQDRLRELRQKLSGSPGSEPAPLSNQEKIDTLKRWLANIQARRKG